MFRANVWNHHEVLGQARRAKTNFWVHVQFLRRLLHIHRTKLQGGRFILECKRTQEQNLQYGMSKQCLFAIDKKYIRKNIAAVFIGIAKTQFLYMKNLVYQCRIYRGSYMSAHVLLNLSNKLWKRDQMRALLSILSLFHQFNKLNNTGAGMLDSFYHMTLKLFLIHIFCVKMLGFCQMRGVKS